LIRLTRRYRFSASHRLDSPAFTAEENRAAYGKCNNPFGHGHNYTIEVSVAGPLDERTGRVADLGQLDRVVEENMLAALDHRHMNDDVEEFRTLVPTTENLAAVVVERLKAAWPRDLAPLDRVRIFETRNNIFEIGNA
jgi:6-pyruvoyltetrahydropterin/6-carboxytetrahydropterin synthase